MIRPESFAIEAETFAADRKKALLHYEEKLRPHVEDALRRLGLVQWQSPIVDAALDVFDESARFELDEWNPIVDTMREAFAEELSETLGKTKESDDFDGQVDRLTRWLATAAVNAGVEAAVVSDTDEQVGLEWVTMEDDKVRDLHVEAAGQTVPAGEAFEIGGEKLLYPGQPVGDPENWINCRCQVRPTMLESSSITAAADPNEGLKRDLEALGATVAPREEEEPPMIPDEEASVPVPWHGVLAPEGIPSGDRRMFAVGAISNRDLPLPLKAMFIDADGHKGSKVGAGRIDRIWKDENNLIWGEGVFDFSEAGYESIRLIAEGMWRGVSVDLDDGEGGVTMAEDGKEVTEITKGRICAATLCAVPAFAEAFITLGPYIDPTAAAESEEPVVEAASSTFEVVPPKTKDGPGWITHPNPTKDITSYWVKGPGAAKIGWGAPGDFNRCRVQLAKYVQNPEWLAGLCANLHYRALGTWPGRSTHSGEKITMTMKPDPAGQEEAFSLVASGTSTLPVVESRYFKNPNLTKPTPLTVEDDGHVYGHVASFDTCHVADPQGEGICTVAPHSKTNYGYFLTGQVVTEAGRVAVGQIVLGGKHAGRRLDLRAATAHYDNTTQAVADIHCGEDEFGTWFSGKLRETATQSQIHELMAAGKVSGDWRGVIVGGQVNLEMIAALAVNVGGFPVPRTEFAMEGDMQLSLTAAGIVDGDKPDVAPEEPAAEEPSPEQDQKRQNVKAAIRSIKAAALQNRINQTLKGE